MDTITIYSVGRSGSTLIRQVVEELFPNADVLSSHDTVNEDTKLIIVYRDFRDVLVSHWRVHEDIDLDMLKNGYKAPEYELDKYINTILKRIETGLNVLAKRSNVLLLKYELFYNNFNYIFDKIEKHFDVNITEENREQIEKKYNIQSNKKRQQKFSSFKDWDDKGIHGLHIYKGEINSWENIVHDSYKDKMNKIMYPHLEKWGYII